MVRPMTLLPISILLGCAICCAVVWASFTSFPRVTVVRGEIIRASGSVEVLASRDGVVRAVSVQAGQSVRLGQSIVRIGEDYQPAGGQSISDVRADLVATYNQLQATITTLNATRSTRLENLEAELKSTQNRLNALRRQRPILAANETNSVKLRDAYQEAFHGGGIARIDLLRQESRVFEFRRVQLDLEASIEGVKSTIAQIEDRRALIEMEFSKELSAFERQLDQISTEMRDLSLLANQEIVATQDGTVKIVDVKVGQHILKGQSIAWIESDYPEFQVVAYVNDEAHKRISMDQILSIELDAFPYQRYGTLSGGVISISPIPTFFDTIDSQSREVQLGVYRISLKIPRLFKDIRGAEHGLNSGMPLSIRIPLDERRLIDWIFPSYA